MYTHPVHRCERFDDGALLLSADFRIDCTSRRFRRMLGVAIFMFAVFPVGVPAVLGWTLWRHRGVLYARNKGATLAVSFGEGDVLAAPRPPTPPQPPLVSSTSRAGMGERLRSWASNKVCGFWCVFCRGL